MIYPTHFKIQQISYLGYGADRAEREKDPEVPLLHRGWRSYFEVRAKLCFQGMRAALAVEGDEPIESYGEWKQNAIVEHGETNLELQHLVREAGQSDFDPRFGSGLFGLA